MLYDHVAIRMTDKSETLDAAKAYGCKMLEGKPGCFTTPGGIVIELVTFSK